MKRRPIHLAFAAAALALGLYAGAQGMQLREAGRVNTAIAAGDPKGPAGDLPEAQLARALALAASGDMEAAVKAYKTLAQGERVDLRRIALYNLGNLYLREAQRIGQEDEIRSLPLVELAKQSYRDLLRSDAEDWDARYNLERALWLSPELEDRIVEGSTQPISSERAITTMQGNSRDLP